MSKNAIDIVTNLPKGPCTEFPSYLDVKSLSNAVLVCKNWHTLFNPTLAKIRNIKVEKLIADISQIFNKIPRAPGAATEPILVLSKFLEPALVKLLPAPELVSKLIQKNKKFDVSEFLHVLVLIPDAQSWVIEIINAKLFTINQPLYEKTLIFWASKYYNFGLAEQLIKLGADLKIKHEYVYWDDATRYIQLTVFESWINPKLKLWNSNKAPILQENKIIFEKFLKLIQLMHEKEAVTREEIFTALANEKGHIEKEGKIYDDWFPAPSEQDQQSYGGQRMNAHQ